MVGGLPADAEDRFAKQDRALNLPVGLTKAQLMVESRLDPTLISPAGARGLAQVMPDTQRSLERRVGRKLNPHDFEDSMLMHHEVMRENLAKFKDVDAALKAYNGGWKPEKWGNAETSAYPVKIRKLMGGQKPWERADIQAEPTGSYGSELRFPTTGPRPWERTDLKAAP